MTYTGLFAMQHRGQESCGIAVNDNREISMYKNVGHVSEVFHDRELDALKGQMAIGHVRYATSGGTGVLNAQPLVSRYIKGQLAMAHNGNLSNAAALKHELEQGGAIFQTTTDTELMMHLLARERLKTGRAETALAEVMKHVEGSYSLVMTVSYTHLDVYKRQPQHPRYGMHAFQCHCIQPEMCIRDRAAYHV